MRVQVDGPGGHDAATGVQFLRTAGVDAPTDHCDSAILDSKIAAEPGNSGAINHGAAANYEVEFWHTITSNAFHSMD